MKGAVLRILLIEDNAGDARLIREMFSKERPGAFELTHVLRMSDGLSHLGTHATDVVLVDMGLPDEHGVATVRRVKAAAPSVPIIVLTGLEDEALAAEAVQAGAEDYLIKGQIESRALPRALRHAIDRRRLQEEATLIKTQQMQLKEEFLSHVSHELRSPLSAIYQFATILADGLSGELTPAQHENMGIVLRNVEQLRAMIDDLLEITRVQAGQLVIEPENMSLTDALAYATSTLRRAATMKGIRIESEVAEDLPVVYADPTRVRQIVVILLDNAIKFTPRGGSVTVRVGLAAQDPGFVHLEVIDSGPGIRHEVTESIFERRFQVDPAVEGRRGLGLGLYICKELVTKQGGRVWARNVPGHGAVLTFTIPLPSLATTIAPVLLKRTARDGQLALISVRSTTEHGWVSDTVRAGWSRDSRALVQACLLRASDLLLPEANVQGNTDTSFVVASGSDNGVAALAERIRERCEQLSQAEQPAVMVRVSYQFLRPEPDDKAPSAGDAVMADASRIEALIAIDNRARSETYE